MEIASYIPDKKFDFKGYNVAYGIIGEGPPLVLVHGTPWSSFSWRKLIGLLSERYKVVYFDLLGFGVSDKPCDHDVGIQMQSLILRALIDFLGLQRPIVIGHDIGGGISLRAHIIEKTDVERIIVIDPVLLSPWGSPFFLHVKKYYDAFVGMPGAIHASILDGYIKTALVNEVQEDALEGLKKPWLDDEGKAAFYHQIRSAKEEDTKEVVSQLEKVKIRVDVLWGELDPWIPVSQASKLTELLPNANKLIIQGVGHLIQEEAPDRLHESITSLLSRPGEN